MKKAGKCVNFNGCQNAACEAGVSYRDLSGEPGEGWVSRLPCWGPSGFAGNGGAHVACASYREPTAEEIAADRQSFEQRFVRIGKVREAIVEKLGGQWKRGMPGASGTIDCPCGCGGKVAFSRAGYNGHIHARCSTPGCAAWME